MTDSEILAVGVFITLAMVGIVVWLWRWSGKPRVKRDERTLCTRCGTIADPEYYRAGSMVVEILLLCFFLVPGIFYDFWRRSKEYWGCPKCGCAEIVPLDSPVAQKIVTG